LYLLIPLSMLVAGLLIWGVIWSVRSGQYDDPDGNAHRILMDDDDPRIPRTDTDKSLKNEPKDQP
ncbi:MAG TPA: cbb3-type cytochrome oxidase assembly protein CcoS, partial [bacterium]|nr:cbb3-type cytochrome oxidase assembly protein CcoS [bacterium]